uniref:Putative ovule protein n=1 Tax=Solanum chacoense TaxID=4108 RepID=A0A0V0H310_SOLCH
MKEKLVYMHYLEMTSGRKRTKQRKNLNSRIATAYLIGFAFMKLAKLFSLHFGRVSQLKPYLYQ